MRVQDLMTRQVHSCRPNDTLEQAAQLMWNFDCGCIPVCTGNGASRVLGMITDRDICMSALFQGKALKDLHVSDAMSKSVETCRSSDSLAAVEKIMQKARIRRLPVLDEEDSVVGMISLADLAREAAHERTRYGKEITNTEVVDSLAAICVPAKQSLAA